MLGSDLAAELASRGHATTGIDLPEFDLTNPQDSARLAGGEFANGVDWVFNCAAYTAVDKAEVDRDAAYMVNGIGPSYLAQACAMAGIKLMHIGTDFVFDGTKTEPYTEEDPTHPLGAYGASKLDGEKAVLAFGAVVVRTAWLFGPNGASFPRTMIRAWLAEKQLKVVSDQYGSPTYTVDLAQVLMDLAERNVLPGIYHVAGREAMNWFDLAKLAITTYRDVVVKSDRPIQITPILTEDWPTPAARPRYSVLGSDRAEIKSGRPMRSTMEALNEFVMRLPEVV